MSQTKPFVIGKVSWDTKRPGNPTPPEFYYREYWVLTDFLQRNNLTVRSIAGSLCDITDDFEIRSDDLTEEGLQFMRTGYQKWLRMLDSGGDPSDTKILEREFARQRGAS
jgi:hypothetical protein